MAWGPARRAQPDGLHKVGDGLLPFAPGPISVGPVGMVRRLFRIEPNRFRKIGDGLPKVSFRFVQIGPLVVRHGTFGISRMAVERSSIADANSCLCQRRTAAIEIEPGTLRIEVDRPRKAGDRLFQVAVPPASVGPPAHDARHNRCQNLRDFHRGKQHLLAGDHPVIVDRLPQAGLEIGLRLVPQELAGKADVGLALADVTGAGGAKRGATFRPKRRLRMSMSCSRSIERPSAALIVRPAMPGASAASRLAWTTLPTKEKSAIAGRRQRSPADGRRAWR